MTRPQPRWAPRPVVVVGSGCGAARVAEALAAGRVPVDRVARAARVHGPVGGRVVERHDGTRVAAAAVVLADEPGSPTVPAGLAEVADDPRVTTALGELDPEDRVLVVGMGPAAVETLVTLAQRGHEGRTLALSRSGRWAHPELDRPHVGRVVVDPPRDSVDALMQWLEEALTQAELTGHPWQPIVDALDLAELWSGWPESERARFLACRRAFERLARRVSPAALGTLEALRERVVLVDRAAELISARAFRVGILVKLRLSGADVPARAGVEELWTFDRLVLCTGRPESELVTNLLARGELHPLVPGDREGRALSREGLVQPDLWRLPSADLADALAAALIEDRRVDEVPLPLLAGRWR